MGGYLWQDSRERRVKFVLNRNNVSLGFHGGMKRWGFHGMPDMHGVTKSHRRIGCIGSGRAKVPIIIIMKEGCLKYAPLMQSRVWPGQKMPGNVGGKYKWACGLRVSDLL